MKKKLIEKLHQLAKQEAVRVPIIVAHVKIVMVVSIVPNKEEVVGCVKNLLRRKGKLIILFVLKKIVIFINL